MECDWEVEIGPDCPVIDAAWDGYIDLRQTPSRVNQIQEALPLPALQDALTRLNSPSSPVFTAKCDVWIPDSFDVYELDAGPESAACGLAAYIDLIPVGTHLNSNFDAIVDWCKFLSLESRSRPLRACRLDTAVRRCFLTPGTQAFGVTMYVIACGPSPQEARKALSAALEAMTDSVMALEHSSQHPSKYNRTIVGE